MKNNLKIVVITEEENKGWVKELENVFIDFEEEVHWLSPLKEKTMDWKSIDLVLVDMINGEDELAIIKSIKENNPKINIVVFSATPRWREARDVMQAGASDYQISSGEPTYLKNILEPKIQKIKSEKKIERQ